MRSAASGRLLEYMYIDAIQNYRAFIFLARPDNGYSPGKLPALDRNVSSSRDVGGKMYGNQPNRWELRRAIVEFKLVARDTIPFAFHKVVGCQLYS